MSEKILVGMSGGVDSSAAALILKESGFDVWGVTLALCEQDKPQDISDAMQVCRKLGIPHIVMDMKKEFQRRVVSYFTEEYLDGKTPNPCIACNRFIKFGAMLDKALDLGFDKIATGHYAKIEKYADRYILKKGADPQKDQSYVLYGLNQHQLSHLELPLGEFSKKEIREMTDRCGLITAGRPDSQDICFVPDGDYAGFIERRCGGSEKGFYKDLEGNILGENKGIIHYTVGQRKGLGIALGEPRFVIEKSAETNTVVLGEEKFLFKKSVMVTDVNFIPFDRLRCPMRVTAKLRYRHKEQPAVLKYAGAGNVTLEFDEPQRAPSPGQSAVFYDGGTVIGGGIIV